MMDPTLIKQHTHIWLRSSTMKKLTFLCVRASAIVVFTQCRIVPLEMRKKNIFFLFYELFQLTPLSLAFSFRCTVNSQCKLQSNRNAANPLKFDKFLCTCVCVHSAFKGICPYETQNGSSLL